jgi:hypothetical protein
MIERTQNFVRRGMKVEKAPVRFTEEYHVQHRERQAIRD